jgi:hypothetical protein
MNSMKFRGKPQKVCAECGGMLHLVVYTRIKGQPSIKLAKICYPINAKMFTAIDWHMNDQ